MRAADQRKKPVFRAIAIFGVRFNRRMFIVAVLHGLLSLSLLSLTKTWFPQIFTVILFYLAWLNQKKWDREFDEKEARECTKIRM